jgi:biotin carboxylase
VRRKEEAGQVVERNLALVAVVRRLTARFRLNNLFNVQFRDADGLSYLLEVNPRMSGGLPFSCQSGLVLPYWALRLALGTCALSDIPEPQTDIWIPQPEPMSSL